MKLTENQRRCLIEATIAPLQSFRRGYARSKQGPFFDPRTVHALVDSGVLRLQRGAGRSPLTYTARAA